MRYTALAAVTALVGQVAAIPAPCPFQAAKRSGLLGEADLEKFEAVRRDPSMAEKLIKSHPRRSGAGAVPSGTASSSSGLTGSPLDATNLLPLGSLKHKRAVPSTAPSSSPHSASSPGTGADGLDLSALTGLLGGLGKNKRTVPSARPSQLSGSSSGSDGLDLSELTGLLGGLGNRKRATPSASPSQLPGSSSSADGLDLSELTRLLSELSKGKRAVPSARPSQVSNSDSDSSLDALNLDALTSLLSGLGSVEKRESTTSESSGSLSRRDDTEGDPGLSADTTANDILDLPLGGGLLNGNLLPLTGVLSGLELPTPQPQGLQVIPGDDPNHQFQSPAPTDVRGLCPTLNALANHGYISRDGITTFAEAANAVQTGYGFSYELSVFLSALGLLAGGDLPTGKYSIGGADPRVPNTLGPALGLDKHGVFEIDGSITREDVYFGNNANFIKQRWDEYVNISNSHGGQFGFDTQAEDNGYRYDISRKTNPQFFAGAIWFAVSHAERIFVYEGLANGTTKDAGLDNVGPFFLDERFPENWFRRGDPLTLPAAFLEAGQLFLSNPRVLGTNAGSVNNFVPIPGIFDPTTSTPAEIGCFLLKAILDLAPGQVAGALLGNEATYLGFVKGAIAPFFTNDGFFNCQIDTYTLPSADAGVDSDGSKSSSGSPVDGAYPGIGVIQPDSQPS